MLSMQELAFLSDQEKQEYMEWERGFESAFWTKLKSMAEQGSDEALQRAALANTWDTNRINNGARGIWMLIANLEEAIGQQFQVSAATRMEAQQRADEVEYE